MKNFIVMFLLVSSVFAGKITIAVAANVSFAIKDLIKEFNKKYPDTKVTIVLGSSGKLTAQIKNAAPYQLFMSANMKYPDSLYKDKLTTGKPVIYAKGELAILSTKKRDFTKGINLLKDKEIEKIAVANPKTAPYGAEAKKALKNASIYEGIKDKFVYGESISQTLSFAVTATDLGIVAKSLLFSSKMQSFKKGENWDDIDRSLYTPISQGIVMLENSKDVKTFYDFILSDSAKRIFRDYGYLVD